MNWRKSKKSKNYGDCVEVANWREPTSSYHNGNCVQVANGKPRHWRKSRDSFSNGACVEAGQQPGSVLVRDTTDNGQGIVLRVPAAEWRRFTASLV